MAGASWCPYGIPVEPTSVRRGIRDWLRTALGVLQIAASLGDRATQHEVSGGSLPAAVSGRLRSTSRLFAGLVLAAAAELDDAAGALAVLTAVLAVGRGRTVAAGMRTLGVGRLRDRKSVV